MSVFKHLNKGNVAALVLENNSTDYPWWKEVWRMASFDAKQDDIFTPFIEVCLRVLLLLHVIVFYFSLVYLMAHIYAYLTDCPSLS